MSVYIQFSTVSASNIRESGISVPDVGGTECLQHTGNRFPTDMADCPRRFHYIQLPQKLQTL